MPRWPSVSRATTVYPSLPRHHDQAPALPRLTSAHFATRAAFSLLDAFLTDSRHVAQRSAVGQARRRRRTAGSRRDLAQRQPPDERALRPQAGERRDAATAAAVRRAASCRSAAPDCWSRWSLAVWLASGFYIVDEGRRGVVDALRQIHGDDAAGAALASALPDRGGRARRLLAGEDDRDRLSQHAEEQGRQGSGDADGRREHHRYPVRGPVQPRRTPRTTSFNNRQPGPDRRSSSPRSAIREVVGKQQDGLRAVRGPRADRQARPRS